MRVEFFNLKFDGSFIVNFLLSKGYRAVKIDEKKLNPNELSAMIIGMGVWYSVKAMLPSGLVIFGDSMKYLGGNIKMHGKKLCELGLLTAGKGETPLLSVAPNLILPEWIDYVKRDVEIDVLATREFRKIEPRGDTSASVAINAWLRQHKHDTGQDYVAKYIEDKYFYAFGINHRSAYRGGWTFVNPKYANKDLKNLYYYDVNSMYPAMMHDCGMPDYEFGRHYATPKTWQEIQELIEPDYFYIFRGKINATIKDDKLPCILVDGGYPPKLEWYITVTHIDFLAIIENYDIHEWDSKGENYYVTRLQYGLFKNFIDINQKIKQTSKGYERDMSKLKQNSCYGKFGTNPSSTAKLPKLVEGVLRFEIYETKRKKLDPWMYLPIAMHITALARQKLRDTIHLIGGYDNVVYGDTDSLVLRCPLPSDIQHPTQLGAWKLEAQIKLGNFAKTKRYKYIDSNDKLVVKCAGMRHDAFGDKNYHQIDLYGEYENIKTKQVKGGVLIYKNITKLT